MSASDGAALDWAQIWIEARLGQKVPEFAACLARACDTWIFAYGSLMWDPGFAYRDAVPAVVHGHHRRFCVYSRRYRGTPERPGLVLGLDRGGSCKGIAYRVSAVDVAAALGYLWEREMRSRVYQIRELPVRLAGGEVRAVAFVVNRHHPSYAGRLSLDETAALIRQGIGGRGSAREYLEKTVRELERLGHLDSPLHRLARRVQAVGSETARI